MKKVIILIAALLSACGVALAIPADPKPFKKVQPDGSVITLQRHGDEWFNWTTEVASGRVVEIAADGFYRAVANEQAYLQARREAGMKLRRTADQMRAQALQSPMTEGTRHIPVILLEFNDLKFVTNNPNQAFDDLLNKKGYSANGAVGSVNDFYMDNSNGKFNPVFDVFGPVQISDNHAMYGDGTGSKEAAVAFNKAIQLLNSEIDFTNYDYDNDGTVDMMLFYYAGHNTAEGGGDDTIWPHQWYFRYAGIYDKYDGKSLGRYFCTSELKGATGSAMCGIGTTCHEFAHSLGLPDFYDTNYGSNGSAGGLYSFSTMDSGSYNSNGTRPPYFNLMERSLLGWSSEPELISKSGNYTLESVRFDKSYYTPTTTDGEIFIFECRDGNKWDAPLPTGLVVYHLDRSRRSGRISGTTPYNLWYNWESSNAINAFGSHPCFYVIPASTLNSNNQNVFTSSALNYYGSLMNMVFGGNRSKFNPVDWEKQDLKQQLTNISYSGGKVTFHIQLDNQCIVSGMVANKAGNPVFNAKVKFGSYEYVTGRDGRYQITIDEDHVGKAMTVTVSCDGFKTQTESFTPTVGSVVKNFTLENANDNTIEFYGYNNFATIFPGQTFHSGDVLELLISEAIPTERKPKNVDWYYDGTLNTTGTVTLTAGKHIVAMKLDYADNTYEWIEYDINVI